jgi:hypothetical protein
MMVRGLVALTLLVCTVLAIDALGFEGRYRKAAWQQAERQGQKLNYQIRHWVDRTFR